MSEGPSCFRSPLRPSASEWYTDPWNSFSYPIFHADLVAAMEFHHPRSQPAERGSLPLAIFASAAIWSVLTFWAASCCARRAMIVSIEAGWSGVGVTGKDAGVTSAASRSSSGEEPTLLVVILSTLLC
uniref:Uncharacterized protein n=1 Tax=Brassica campestris TaxID=3711 RepID=M4DFB6_BRACM